MVEYIRHRVFGEMTIKKYVFLEVLYTLLIIAISVGITNFTVFSQFNPFRTSSTQRVAPLNVGQQAPPASEDNYVERGSPYDNRTVGSQSANVTFHGSRDKKQIALTFDAEMTDSMRAAVLSGRVKSSYNKQIIDTLIATNTKATLFLTGMWIEMYPDVVKQLSQNSLFELGSHSYTDSSYAGYCYGLTQLADTVKIEDLGATEKLLREYAGINNQLFRFPGGCYTPADVKLANEAGDQVVHWDVVGADGFNTNTAQIVHNVVDNVQNGSIIVLHMNGAPTAPRTGDALPTIISQLKAKGFEFVKVYELLGLPKELIQPL